MTLDRRPMLHVKRIYDYDIPIPDECNVMTDTQGPDSVMNFRCPFHLRMTTRRFTLASWSETVSARFRRFRQCWWSMPGIFDSRRLRPNEPQSLSDLWYKLVEWHSV